LRAFNAGDVKALLALWTEDCEYAGPDGEPVRGRKALEKAYEEFFKKHPKSVLQIQTDSLRLHGKHTAVLEGTAKVLLPGEKAPIVLRFSALNVHEDSGWKLASVREWAPDAVETVSLSDAEWLIGDWTAKSDKAEVHVSYFWDDSKAFLRGKYTLIKDGKEASKGVQIIGKDPGRGLRSWLFDASGAFGEGTWSRDSDRWIIEASGTLPDRGDVTAVIIIVPLGPDAFTWQTVQRTVGDTELPDEAPIRVTRVKTGK
jgi:uncharacterized protein (TIGR02246 family)